MGVSAKDLEIKCVGTGEPWKVLEQENSLDDLSRDQLVKGLDSSLTHLSGVALWEGVTEH